MLNLQKSLYNLQKAYCAVSEWSMNLDGKFGFEKTCKNITDTVNYSEMDSFKVTLMGHLIC